jgi:hypothetical protein
MKAMANAYLAHHLEFLIVTKTSQKGAFVP